MSPAGSLSSRHAMFPLSLKEHCAKLSTEIDIGLTAPELLITRLSSSNDNGETSRKNAKMQILRVDSNGQTTTLELKRSEVLKLTQEAASMNMLMGEKMSPRKSKIQLLTAGSYHAVQMVHGRDLRKLDAAFAANNDPCVIVRKQAIVISTELVRTIIMRDACLIYASSEADEVVPILRAKLHELIGEKESDSTSFEFRAIEAVLSTICNLLYLDCEKTFPKIMNTLERLAQAQISATELETLRSLKNTINDFGSQVDGIRRVLMELLDSDSDLRMLYLTLLCEDPDLLSHPVPFDPEEAEALLESYLQEIHTIRTKTKLLQQRIQNTESLIMIKLDTARNHLLTVDLVFSLVTVSLTFGTFVTAAFGMNLVTGLEEEVGAFTLVMLATLLVSVVMVVLGVLYFRRRGVM